MNNTEAPTNNATDTTQTGFEVACYECVARWARTDYEGINSHANDTGHGAGSLHFVAVRLTTYTVDSRYDRQVRSWVTVIEDADGHQVGSAQFDGTKADRDASRRYLQSKIDAGKVNPDSLEGFDR